MISRIRYAALLVALLLPAPGAAQLGGGEAETVSVKGSAPLMGGVPASRERALQQAFRTAVEQVAGVMVESSTLVENFALFEDNILTRTEGYVRDYRIIWEGEEEGGIYTVEADIEVVPGRLSRDIESLGILLKRANYPLVSVEVFATSMTDLPPETNARLEGEVRAILRDRGLEVVDPSARGVDPSVRIEATVELTDQGDAAGMGLQSASARVSMEAIEETTGSIMAAATGRSNGAGVSAAAARDQAGIRAMDGALEELVDDLINEWSDRVNNQDAILITVHGVTEFGQVTYLSGLIQDEFGETRDIVERQVDVDRGRAMLEWRGRSDARSLAIWLDRYDFERFELVVIGTGGSMVQVEIREN